MADDFRHHRVSRDPDVRVVLVPYPVPEAGSPKQKHLTRPGPYPRQGRDHPRLSKAQKVQNLVRGIAQQEADVRAFLDSFRRRREQAGA
jgi:hypothetical protein